MIKFESIVFLFMFFVDGRPVSDRSGWKTAPAQIDYNAINVWNSYLKFENDAFSSCFFFRFGVRKFVFLFSAFDFVLFFHVVFFFWREKQNGNAI